MKVREVMTIKEASVVLKVAQQSVRNMIKRGDLESFRIGNLFRVYTDSLPNYKED